MYRCSKCSHEFESLPVGLIRCSNCGNKIFFKTRSPVEKRILAR